MFRDVFRRSASEAVSIPDTTLRISSALLCPARVAHVGARIERAVVEVIDRGHEQIARPVVAPFGRSIELGLILIDRRLEDATAIVLVEVESRRAIDHAVVV